MLTGAHIAQKEKWLKAALDTVLPINLRLAQFVTNAKPFRNRYAAYDFLSKTEKIAVTANRV